MEPHRPAVQRIGHIYAAQHHVLFSYLCDPPRASAVGGARGLAAVVIRSPGVVTVQGHHFQYIVDAAVRSGGPGGPAVAAREDYTVGVQEAVAASDAVLRIHEGYIPEGQRFLR